MTQKIPVIKHMFYHNKTFYCFYNGIIKEVDMVRVKRSNKAGLMAWIDPKSVSIRTLRLYKIQEIQYKIREESPVMGNHRRYIHNLDDINVVSNKYIVASKDNIVTGFTCLGLIKHNPYMYNGRRREGVITTLKKLDRDKNGGNQVK